MVFYAFAFVNVLQLFINFLYLREFCMFLFLLFFCCLFNYNSVTRRNANQNVVTILNRMIKKNKYKHSPTEGGKARLLNVLLISVERKKFWGDHKKINSSSGNFFEPWLIFSPDRVFHLEKIKQETNQREYQSQLTSKLCEVAERFLVSII